MATIPVLTIFTISTVISWLAAFGLAHPAAYRAISISTCRNFGNKWRKMTPSFEKKLPKIDVSILRRLLIEYFRGSYILFVKNF